MPQSAGNPDRGSQSPLESAHKEQADKLLNSEQGIRYRKKRAVDVEPVFANIKSNHGFKHLMLKGMTKTEIEIGLLSIAHNLRKWKA